MINLDSAVNHINSGYTGMMGVGSGEWGVGESGIIDIDFIIPMQPETISSTKKLDFS